MLFFKSLRFSFVRRIRLNEQVSKEDLLRAFDVYKKLAYQDCRISFKDLISLIHSMLDGFVWDHYM